MPDSIADHTEIHETVTTAKGAMAMQEMESGVALDPGTAVTFTPGGKHVMLVDLVAAARRRPDVRRHARVRQGRLDHIAGCGRGERALISRASSTTASTTSPMPAVKAVALTRRSSQNGADVGSTGFMRPLRRDQPHSSN